MARVHHHSQDRGRLLRRLSSCCASITDSRFRPPTESRWNAMAGFLVYGSISWSPASAIRQDAAVFTPRSTSNPGTKIGRRNGRSFFARCCGVVLVFPVAHPSSYGCDGARSSERRTFIPRTARSAVDDSCFVCGHYAPAAFCSNTGPSSGSDLALSLYTSCLKFETLSPLLDGDHTVNLSLQRCCGSNDPSAS